MASERTLRNMNQCYTMAGLIRRAKDVFSLTFLVLYTIFERRCYTYQKQGDVSISFKNSLRESSIREAF